MIKRRIIAIFIIFSFLTTAGFGCKTTDKATEEAMQPITLEYWRVFDGPDAFEDIISAYEALHPYITINYKKLRYAEYEQALLEAWADGEGPDIFSIQNTWVDKYESKIEPMPEYTSAVYMTEQGSIKTEVVPELQKEKSLTLKEIKNNFVDVVYDDAVKEVIDEDTDKVSEEVMGLPLSVDTLAMFYNKDLLNNAGVALPPSYWNEEFQEIVKETTLQNTKGLIIQSGTALGGSDNVERSFDILSALMMQNGAEMMDESGSVLFNTIPDTFKSEKYNPGLDALRFYTDFANPSKEVYCWNNTMDNSIDLFSRGKVALVFGYSYHLPVIKANAPKLNFGVAKLPQIEGSLSEVNYANYWLETVSKRSENSNEAWNFVQFATKAEQAAKYLAATGKPTALRSLIETQTDDLEIGPFAEQVLTAKSWYHGANVLSAEEIVNEMIDSAVAGEEDIDDVINLGARRVQQTIE